jgi:hypothetical protein
VRTDEDAHARSVEPTEFYSGEERPAGAPTQQRGVGPCGQRGRKRIYAYGEGG